MKGLVESQEEAIGAPAGGRDKGRALTLLD